MERLRESVSGVVADAVGVWERAYEDVRGEADRLLASGGIGGLVLDGRLGEVYRWALGVFVVGVDSSRTRPVRLGFRYVSFVSGAAVTTVSGGEVLFLGVRPVVLPDEAKHEGFRVELELEMFDLEAAALEAVAERGANLVLLDGPIVDPPGMYGEASRYGLEEKYLGYVERRAAAIRALQGSGGLVVGFVKRLRGRLFWEWVREALGGPEWMDVVNDYFLGVTLARAFRGPLARLQCEGPGMVLVTRPFELDESRIGDYTLYREQGLRVYTSLLVPGFCRGNHKPSRIEFVVPEDGDPEWEALRAAAAVEAHLLEGAWIPTPVLAAHRACTIRSRESLRLLREAGSLYAREMLEALGEEDAEAVEGLYNLFD